MTLFRDVYTGSKAVKKSMCIGHINVSITVPSRVGEGDGDWERHVEARVLDLSSS